MPNQLRHVCFIMDGNRRWAKAHGKTLAYAYDIAGQTCHSILHHCRDLGFEVVTIWAFSTANWNRTQIEINCVFHFIDQYIKQYLDELNGLGVRVNHIGDMAPLPDFLKQTITHAISTTERNGGLVFNLAINYGGEDELNRAARKLASDDKTPFESRNIIDYLDTAGQPNPDFIVRTGGDERTSSFFPLQSGFSEWFFVKNYWPAFTTAELDTIIQELHLRKRNFGT